MPHILTELPSDQAIITLRQLIIPSSFVAKVSSVTLKPSQGPSQGNVTVAQFRLGRGGWIIQAKASIQAVGEVQQPVSVFWDLTAEVAIPFPPRDNVDVRVLDPTMELLVFGVQVSTTAVVDLTATNKGGDVSALISNIVITGIKQDEVISLAM